MLKISYAGYLGLFPAGSPQFTLEMRVAAQNREKFTKTPYFASSRSFKVLDNLLPICSHFHVRRANSGKI